MVASLKSRLMLAPALIGALVLGALVPATTAQVPVAVVSRVLLDGIATDEVSAAVDLSHLGSAACVVYVEWDDDATAGVVTVEEAFQSAYAGTWTSVQVVNFPAAGVVDSVHLDGPMGALRTRISTAIADGTVTTKVVCR